MPLGLAKKYPSAAGLSHKGACHVFRHTMATLMPEGGAAVRYIQEMLGHAALSTTEIYTKVTVTKLKEVHERMHPARLSRSAMLAAEGFRGERMTTHASGEFFPADVKAKLESLAATTGRTPAEVMAEALDAYAHERTEWLRALDEGVRAADEGRVVDGDKVDAWLSSWGTDDELDPPTCDD